MADKTPIVLLPDASAVAASRPTESTHHSPVPRPGRQRSPSTKRLIDVVHKLDSVEPDLHVRLSPARLGSSRGALTFTPPAWAILMEPEPVAEWVWTRPMHDDGAWTAESGNQNVSLIIDLKKLALATSYVVSIRVRAERRPAWTDSVWPATPRYILEQSETTWSWEPVNVTDEDTVRTLTVTFIASRETQRLRLLPEGIVWLHVYDVEARRV